MFGFVEMAQGGIGISCIGFNDTADEPEARSLIVLFGSTGLCLCFLQLG